nr:EOG090X04ZD [Cyclestheria hislopi]
MATNLKKRDSKLLQKEIIVQIKEKAKEVIQNRKKINNVADILMNVENDDKVVVAVSIKALDRIFCHLAALDLLSENDNQLESDNEKQVREWSRERYSEFQEHLILLLSTEHITIQEQSLVSLMHLISAEAQNPLCVTQNKGPYFPLSLLEKIVNQMLSLDCEMVPVLTRFQEFLEYDDVLFHLLRVLGTILKTKKEVNDIFMKNLFYVLEHLTLETPDPKSERKKLLCLENTGFQMNYSQAKKYFSSVWQHVLKYPLTPSLYKRVLILLPEKVMPHLEKPLLLTDFLMDSYNIGGAVSLLALHGVFLLMQNHNLEYPDFYTKLYALLEPSVLFVKYRARFFYLCDLFMTSTHVPEYIAAAFIKRMARLSLTAPANVVVLLLHFIGNLIMRHRGLLRLVHNPDHQNELSEDPYLMDERNPALCRATESSLWEIKSLQNHILPDVAIAAKFIDRDLPKLEWDISQDLELTLEDMIEKEMKRERPQDVPVNFEKPAKFACIRNEKFAMGYQSRFGTYFGGYD